MLETIRMLFAIAAISVSFVWLANGQSNKGNKSSRYLFVWAGDADRKESDFLSIIDVRPNTKQYGRIVMTLPVGAKGTYPHHTNHEMPDGGVLFANGYGSGQTFRFDLREPLNPKLLDSFIVPGEYMHPHSFVRLSNGDVLSTLQMRGHANSEPGALVRLDAEGNVLKIADASDPKVEKFIRPYSLAVVPAIDRVVTTSSDMEAKEISHVVQVWRLSDLKLIKSIYLDGAYGVDPAEPRVLSDGRTVMVSTFSCGLYRVKALESENPSAEFVHFFGGAECALPVVAGNFWVQTITDARAIAVIDVSKPKPVEVSRLVFGPGEHTHWISLEPNGERIVISGGKNKLENKILIARLNRANGALSLDMAFREKGSSEPGINFDRPIWPHGNNGRAIPHGAVFSRN